MDELNALGVGRVRREAARQGVEHLMLRRPLARVLAFTGRTIDDVVNCPIVKNEVRGYFRLSRQIDRAAEVGELERQWNPLGRRVV